LPRAVYGYLSNPLLQEELSFLPLATCFDYAADPIHYDPESSWKKIVCELFGAEALPRWRALRKFFADRQRAKKTNPPLRLRPDQRQELQLADAYIRKHRARKWAREIRPWQELLRRELK
jgi:hypothetical protein